MNYSMRKFLLILPAVFLLAGCTLTPASSSQKSGVIDGGVWRSADAGRTFVSVSDVASTKGKVNTIVSLDANKIVLDPQDASTAYLATVANGIYYSLDSGNTWQQFKSMNSGSVSNIAVDYQNKCIVYAVSGNKLFKTENCGRDFNNIYYHQKSQVTLTAIAVSAKVPQNVYLGTSAGEVLKSIDGGHAWLTVNRVEHDKITDLIIDPYDNKIIYAATGNSGIFKSIDNGINWVSLSAGLAQYSGSNQYRKLVYDQATQNSLMLISKFGVLRTTDGGTSWTAIELLPAHKTTAILAVAINPLNSKEFYYTTASSLVKTIDGGIKWTSIKLPYSRLTSDIEINPVNPNIVYLIGIKPKGN